MSLAGRLTETLKQRLLPIKAILFDVEGTLTDGAAMNLTRSLNTKALAPDDKEAIQAATEMGYTIGIITGRAGNSINELADSAGITDVYQGYLNKSSAYDEFKMIYGFADEEIAYMGDDILDLAVIRMAGFSAAPFNAHSSVRIAAHFVCRARGGNGAASEMLHLLFAARNESPAL